jgi:hypothetical protein
MQTHVNHSWVWLIRKDYLPKLFKLFLLKLLVRLHTVYSCDVKPPIISTITPLCTCKPIMNQSTLYDRNDIYADKVPCKVHSIQKMPLHIPEKRRRAYRETDRERAYLPAGTTDPLQLSFWSEIYDSNSNSPHLTTLQSDLFGEYFGLW